MTKTDRKVFVGPYHKMADYKQKRAELELEEADPCVPESTTAKSADKKSSSKSSTRRKRLIIVGVIIAAFVIAVAIAVPSYLAASGTLGKLTIIKVHG